MDIPFDLSLIVASFLIKPRMKLLDWIPEDKLNWKYLSANPNAIHMLEKHPEKMNWSTLSYNSNAMHILENNLDKINWNCLSVNSNAIHLLTKNFDKIQWAWLNCNPNAMHILEKYHMNPHVVKYWEYLSANPSIFEIDTEQMKIKLMKKAKNIDYV